MDIGWRRGMKDFIEDKLVRELFSKFGDIPDNIVIIIKTDYSEFVGNGRIEMDKISNFVKYIHDYFIEKVQRMGLLNATSKWNSIEFGFFKREDPIYGLVLNNRDYMNVGQYRQR